MVSRRKFISASVVAVSGALLMDNQSHAGKSADFPKNVVFTAEQPGIWSKKVTLHVPEVKIMGDSVVLTNVHPMGKEHYIVRHTVVDEDGNFIGGHTFKPTDKRAVSSFKLPSGSSGRKFYATSFCNLHDFWVTEFIPD